jgi:CRISPR-associated protein Csm2
MSQPIKPLNPPKKQVDKQTFKQDENQKNKKLSDPSSTIQKHIDGLSNGLSTYDVETLVTHAQQLGKFLAADSRDGGVNLKTNQIRKFLDTLKQLKAKQAREIDVNRGFVLIKDSIQLMRPQLAYASAKKKNDRTNPVEPFKIVLDSAIQQVKTPQDFHRLVDLVEAIVAYHKAEGGSEQ